MNSNKPKETIQPPAVKVLQSLFTTFGPIFPNVMGWLVYKFWFTIPRLKVPQREKMAAANAQKSTIEVDGQTLRLWSWGNEGPTILFIHGWAGRGTQIVSFIEPLLECGFNVISYDAPAHGESTGKSTDIFKLANALSAVINHTGDLHGVITHSLGAMTLGLLDQNSVNIDKIVFVAPPATLDLMTANFQRVLKIPDPALDAFIKLLKKNYGDDVDERVSLLNNAEKFQCETLIIHDEHDLDLPWTSSEKLSKKLPNAKFIKTKNLGHIRVLYDDEVIDAVKKFFSTDD